MFPEYLNSAVALLLIRTIAGILFFSQGYDKLFNVKIINIVRSFNQSMSKIFLPEILIKPAITISSVIEMIAGLMLIVGLYKDLAMYFLAADLIFVSVIFSLLKPMWDLQFFFPRLILLSILLLVPSSIDILSIDSLLSAGVK